MNKISDMNLMIKLTIINKINEINKCNKIKNTVATVYNEPIYLLY
jgi:hypothetical protein